MEKPLDNCDHCGRDYEFDPHSDALIIDLSDSTNLHIRARCPHCDGLTDIFVDGASAYYVMTVCHLPIRLVNSVDPEASVAIEDKPEPPELPDYDLTLRHLAALAQLRTILDTMAATEIVDEMSLPAPPRSMPESWV